jgi:hypothetical protein
MEMHPLLKSSCSRNKMAMGKYPSYFSFFIAKLIRENLRLRISKIFSWSKKEHSLNPGCTAIIGMTAKLPFVLSANLRCLSDLRWQDLKQVQIAVDDIKGTLPEGFEIEIKNKYSNLNINFNYYTKKQKQFAEKMCLPYIYSWLSWCICIDNTKTKNVLIHDYDALVFGSSLEKRYRKYEDNKSIFQGISYYRTNGFDEKDMLATTFEAFVDVEWALSLPPVNIFNKVGRINGKTVDFDSFLYAQYQYPDKKRMTIDPMNGYELVHPSQMIHQYTMFRKDPGAKLPCYSIVMIPFFNYIGGNADALVFAKEALLKSKNAAVDLLGDGSRFNLSLLETKPIDLMLKNMVQACLLLKELPSKDLIEYGIALYEKVGASADEIWRGDFSEEQRRWIDKIYGNYNKI